MAQRLDVRVAVTVDEMLDSDRDRFFDLVNDRIGVDNRIGMVEYTQALVDPRPQNSDPARQR